MRYSSSRIVIALSILACTLAVAESVQGAAVILRNTGVAANGSLYSNDQLTDNKYNLVSSPLGANITPFARAAAGGFPVGPWLADNSTSRWITPTIADNHAVGTYTYSTTFDLTGLIASTANVNGRWASDNNAVMRLNGSQVSLSPSFTAWTNFNITNFFVAGVNVLEFVVTNAAGTVGNPTGLRVEMSGTATPVPEPASIAMWSLGALGLVFARRKRQQMKLAV